MSVKPTLHELEKILAEPGGKVEILPDGRVVVDAELTRLRTRVAELEKSLERAELLNETHVNRPDIDTIECFFLVASENVTTMSRAGIDSALGLVEYAKLQEARVAALEHSLADAMEQIAAIQGTNATHMARVEELVDLVEELYPLIGSQYDVPELRERVRAQTEGSRASDIVSAQKSRPMSEAPRDGTKILVRSDIHSEPWYGIAWYNEPDGWNEYGTWIFDANSDPELHVQQSKLVWWRLPEIEEDKSK